MTITTEQRLARFYTDQATDEHTVVTPLELCYNVINNIPSLNGTVLVIANIEWLFVLRDKFNKDMSEVTFITPCENKSIAVRTGFPEVTVVVSNLLEMDFGMKFDVVIGNPPYHKVVGKTKISIAHLFAKKGFSLVKDGGYFCLINSNSGVSAGQNTANDILYNNKIDYVSPASDGAKYFPEIGIGISAYVVHKTNCGAKDFKYSNQGETLVLNKDDFEFHHDGVHYIPVDIVQADLIPLKKVLSYSNNTFQFRGGLHKKVITNKTFFDFQTSNKIPVAPSRFRSSNSPGVMHHPCAVPGVVNDKILKSVFCSPLFHWVIERVMGKGASCRPSGVSYFPIIPLNKIYTYETLCDVFSLTEDERDYITAWAKQKPANYWDV